MSEPVNNPKNRDPNTEFIYLNNIKKENYTNASEKKEALNIEQKSDVLTKSPSNAQVQPVMAKPASRVRICEFVQNIETKEKFSLANDSFLIQNDEQQDLDKYRVDKVIDPAIQEIKASTPDITPRFQIGSPAMSPAMSPKVMNQNELLLNFENAQNVC